MKTSCQVLSNTAECLGSARWSQSTRNNGGVGRSSVPGACFLSGGPLEWASVFRPLSQTQAIQSVHGQEVLCYVLQCIVEEVTSVELFRLILFCNAEKINTQNLSKEMDLPLCLNQPSSSFLGGLRMFVSNVYLRLVITSSLQTYPLCSLIG